MMAGTLKTQAIVLRHAQYREADRMLTLFSPELGRLDAKAAGCLRQKSHLTAASEIFAVGEYLLLQRGGRHTVTGFALEESYYPLRADYDRLRYGAYLLQLTEAVVQPEQPYPELFVLLRAALAHLTYGEAPAEAASACFLMSFAGLLGLSPMLSACARCGQTRARGWRLDDLAGGLVCDQCESAGEHITPQGIGLLKAIQKEGLSFLEREGLPDLEMTQSMRFLRRFVEGRMEKPIRSAKLL